MTILNLLFTATAAIQPTDFASMIHHTTKGKSRGIDIMGYGCYCGIAPQHLGSVPQPFRIAQNAEMTCDLYKADPKGDKLKPMDPLDECCRIHDKCFCEFREMCPGESGYTIDYGFNTRSGSIQCEKGWGLFSTAKCRVKLCECDKAAAECFARHYNSRKQSHYNPPNGRCSFPESSTECQDFPLGWKDQDGDDCAKYKARGWCKASWQSSYKDPTGKTADQACCGCGGGKKQKMCKEFKKMACKQNCPAGFKHVATSNHGCCASFGNCGGNMKHCEKMKPCPENKCRHVKKMSCKQGCPSGWKHIHTSDHGCCKSWNSCGGNRKHCEKYLPCGRRLEDTEFVEIMSQQYKPQDDEIAEDLA